MTIDTPNADTSNSNSGTDTGDAPKWWVDENIPGNGDRPEWLHEKFKSVGDMARSYAELEKRVGNAPDNYDFAKSKYLDSEYGPFKDLQELAKSKRVPAEVMDKMIESVDKYMSEFSSDYKEEMAQLGDNAKERLKLLNNWAQANLSDESFQALTTHITTASGIKALEELRNKMMSNTTTIPNGNDNTGKGDVSLEELQAELNNNLDKYKTDPKYRKELQNRIELAARQSTFVDKAW